MNFNFWKKKPHVVAYHYNKEVLSNALVNILNKMPQYRGDEAMNDIREMIQILKNGAVLDSAHARDAKDHTYCQAKIEVFTEFDLFIEQAINRVSQEKKEGKKPVRGTFNSVRKTQNLAGSSI